MLQPCQEKERRQIKSFGWIIRDAVDEIGIGNMMVSPTVPLSNVPPWLLGELEVDLHLLEWKKENSIDRSQVSRYQEEKYSMFTKIYTDASKTDDNRVGAAFIIPETNVMLNKRVNDKMSVFTGEMLAILLALEWVENSRPMEVLTGSDSSSALTSIKNMQSEARQDIMLEIAQTVFRSSSKIHLDSSPYRSRRK